MQIFNLFSFNKLAWVESVGIGFLDAPSVSYDEAYFNNYVGLTETDIGRALNQARLDLVAKYIKPEASVIDIGIGSGAFVKGRPGTYGYDINPVAIEWLHDQGLYNIPDKYNQVQALTFWDSLEHIKDPTEILEGAKEFVFVSCPIYHGIDHALASKHYKPGEHFWYWTADGLATFMYRFGFELVEHNTMETGLGREDIGTFVFKRAK